MTSHRPRYGTGPPGLALEPVQPGREAFVWTWNNFLWPFLAATSQTMMTIPAGLGTVIDGVGIINALQMASAVLGAPPLVFVFLLAQRRIVEGVAGTGLK